MFYKTLSLSELKREFEAYDKDYFSEEGLKFIEDFKTVGDLYELTELEIMAICGEFTESSLQTFAKDEGIEFSDFDDITLIEQFGTYIENHFIINDLKNILDLENMIEDSINNGYFDSVSEAKNSRLSLIYIYNFIYSYSRIPEVLDYLLNSFYNALDMAANPKSLLEQYLDENDVIYSFLSNGNIIYCNTY